MRVLIVEDEPKLASLLRKGLTAQGLAADIATHGDQAMYMATATAYDAITLDVMLPDTDGFTLCKEFRRHGIATPVLMITALDTIHDRVTGLDSGADDYLAKPFSFAELLARRGVCERTSTPELPARMLAPPRETPAARTPEPFPLVGATGSMSKWVNGGRGASTRSMRFS